MAEAQVARRREGGEVVVQICVARLLVLTRPSRASHSGRRTCVTCSCRCVSRVVEKRASYEMRWKWKMPALRFGLPGAIPVFPVGNVR